MSEKSAAASLRLLLAQTAIGAAAIFARFALEGTGPVAASALRLTIATAPLLALAYVRGRGRPRPSARREALFAVAGFLLALHFAAWLASLEFTSVALSTLLVCTTPLWSALGEAVAARRLPRTATLGAFALALAGIIPIALDRNASAPIGGHALLGDALALIGSFAIGGYLAMVRRYGARPREGNALPTVQVVARTYAWAALALILASVALRQQPPAISDAHAWFGIIAMASISQLLGHTLLNAALRDFPPSIVAMATLLEPVIAAAIAAAVFHESLSPLAIAGAALVLAGVALALRAHERG